MTMKPSAKQPNNNKSKKPSPSPPPPTLSKRQRHAAGPNPSNTWQQQPRIKSAGARARAYIAYAGLADDEEEEDTTRGQGDSSNKVTSSGGGNTTSAASKLLLDPQIDLNSAEVKFGKLLGGTDQRKRHEAVKMLRNYLKSRADFTKGGVGFSQLDFLKLWKALWYTLYMADKAPVQDKLSKILAELMWCLAGTEEEDEYAGAVFLKMEREGEYFEDDRDEEEEEEDDDRFDRIVGQGVFEDDDGDTMEIIEMDENSDDNDEEDDEDCARKMNSDESDDEDGDDDAFDDDEVQGEDDEDEVDDYEQRVNDMNEKHCRGAHLVCLYISTFLCTIRREWGNVDKHRVDKFYTAVRLMIREAYKYMSKRGWNIGIIHLFNDALYEEGLSAETPGLTNGLRYHLIDICIDELAKVNKDSEIPLTEATFLDCIEPFFVLAQRAADKNVQKRVMDNVLLKFLNEYSFVSTVATSIKAEDDENALVFDQVHVGTVSKFIFQIASESETDERFRKSLYDMHKRYERQIKTAGRDVGMNDELNEDVDCNDVNNPNSNELQSSVAEVLSEENDYAVLQISHEKEETLRSTTSKPNEKKKRKKKKKERKIDTGDPDIDDIANLGDGTVSDLSTPRKSSSKKKRKHDGECEVNNEVEVQDSATRCENVDKRAISLIKSNSLKKQQKKKNVEPADNLHLIISHVETPAPDSTKKKKTSPPSVDPRSPRKSASKKKRKHDENREVNNEVEVQESATRSENDDKRAVSLIKSNSLKKQQKKKNVEPADNSHLITSHVETPAPNSKKKKKTSPPSVDPRSMHSLDQITSPGSDGSSASPSRRVSFGAINQCKSHKASMKAVKTLEKERWDTKRTPEKSILRPKSTDKMKNRNQETGQSSSRKKKG